MESLSLWIYLSVVNVGAFFNTSSFAQDPALAVQLNRPVKTKWLGLIERSKPTGTRKSGNGSREGKLSWVDTAILLGWGSGEPGAP